MSMEPGGCLSWDTGGKRGKLREEEERREVTREGEDAI
jgi:hypothetical protein